MISKSYQTKPEYLEAALVGDLLNAAKNDWDALPGWVADEYEKGNIFFGARKVVLGNNSGGLESYLVRYEHGGLSFMVQHQLDTQYIDYVPSNVERSDDG